MSLIRAFFMKKKSTVPTLLRVKIFHDEEKKIIGLKPDEGGYKFTKSGGAYTFCCKELQNITQGKFYPEWSEKDKMLVFSI